MENLDNPSKYYRYISRRLNIREKSKFEKAYDQAVAVRNFEIELYWKRAIYFWTFIGLAFGGFFLLKENDYTDYSILRALTTLVGLVFSIAWYFVNKGSKYWQETWETHVDLLERKVTGPIFGTILDYHKSFFKKYSFCHAYPYSVSKINLVLSFFIILIWVFLFFYSLGDYVYIKVLNFKELYPNLYQLKLLHISGILELFKLFVPLNFIYNFTGLSIGIIFMLTCAETTVIRKDRKALMSYKITFNND